MRFLLAIISSGPHGLFDALPILRYLVYTPTYHSLHHTEKNSNYCLFMPLFDLLGGTLSSKSWELQREISSDSGFWKATGIDRPIHSKTSDSGDCVGLKKSLVYYRGSTGKGTKTDWMMHEFCLPSKHQDTESCSPSIQEAEIWTICRIFKWNVSFKKYGTQGWKQSATPKQTPADSSSKTSSFESDSVGDEYMYLGCAASFQQGDRMIPGYNIEDHSDQLFGGQWINPAAMQAPAAAVMAALHPAGGVVPSPNTNEFVKDGSWDELVRIMEYYMMNPSTTQECGRYY